MAHIVWGKLAFEESKDYDDAVGGDMVAGDFFVRGWVGRVTFSVPDPPVPEIIERATNLGDLFATPLLSATTECARTILAGANFGSALSHPRH